MESSTVQRSAALEKENTVAIVLAAGQGKRMKTELPKVAHTILGKPLLIWSLQALLDAGVKKVVVVLSPAQKVVEDLLKTYPLPAGTEIKIAHQETPLGTGHAAQSGFSAAGELLKNSDVSKANVLVSLGDMPAVSPQTYHEYFLSHTQQQNSFTVMAFQPTSPTGYGRVLCDGNGKFLEIKEEKDCSESEKRWPLCNSGFLYARYQDLAKALPQLKNTNAAKEFYLTDVPKIGLDSGQKVGVYKIQDAAELDGVNSQAQLANVTKYVQARLIKRWLDNGVQFLNPDAVYLEDGVTFESDVIVEPFVYLAGKTHFPKGSRITAGSRIIDGKRT